jgi:hypothetical protein
MTEKEFWEKEIKEDKLCCASVASEDEYLSQQGSDKKIIPYFMGGEV